MNIKTAHIFIEAIKLYRSVQNEYSSTRVFSNVSYMFLTLDHMCVLRTRCELMMRVITDEYKFGQ